MPWTRGQCLVWDVTCPDTLASSYLNRAVTGAGAVANEAERRKHLKYETISRSHHFVPIAIETLGALGEEAMAFLRELSSHVAAVTKDSRSLTLLMQRISITVQQGNATCIMGTMSNTYITLTSFYCRSLWPTGYTFRHNLFDLSVLVFMELAANLYQRKLAKVDVHS